MKNKKKETLLHLVIAALACANLVLLFLFEYGLPSSTHAVLAAQRASEERAALHASAAEIQSAAEETQQQNEDMQ